MSMSPRERIGYAAISALLLFGFGFVGARRMRQPAPIVFQTGAAIAQATPTAWSAAPNSSESVVVHVAGAVKIPGVVRLPGGARVVDAIHAAGGPSAKADLDSINMAAKLIDGTQLRVPTLVASGSATPKTTPVSGAHTRARPQQQIDKSGYFAPVEIAPQYLPKPEITPVATKGVDTGATSTAVASKSKAPATEVDLNTATLQDLEGLPGVGPSTAQKILDYRSQHGAFHSSDELLAVKGIGPKKLEKMKPYLRI